MSQPTLIIAIAINVFSLSIVRRPIPEMKASFCVAVYLLALSLFPGCAVQNSTYICMCTYIYIYMYCTYHTYPIDVAAIFAPQIFAQNDADDTYRVFF